MQLPDFGAFVNRCRIEAEFLFRPLEPFALIATLLLR